MKTPRPGTSVPLPNMILLPSTAAYYFVHNETWRNIADHTATKAAAKGGNHVSWSVN